VSFTNENETGQVKKLKEDLRYYHMLLAKQEKEFNAKERTDSIGHAFSLEEQLRHGRKYNREILQKLA
jgi:hypothetical protein